jgi:hypothetical protein
MLGSSQNQSGYPGQESLITLGVAGLFTDAAQCNIPVSGLIRANNVTYYNQIIQKDYGSRIWNSNPCPASIVRAAEMYPDSQSQLQRLYALCANGQIYKFNNYFTQTQVTVLPGQTNAPSSLFTSGYNSFVLGGNELLNNPKKLFLFNGYNTPQVISGDSNQRYNISMPAFDWIQSSGPPVVLGTAQPFGGVIHRGALYAWGNTNNPHQIYASNVENHEDFQTVGAAFTYSIYPGEYDGIVAGCVFRGRLYIYKYPLGVYYLVDSDADRANWYFTKQSDDFGACSPQSVCVALNDLFIANNYGSVSSMLAALVFGDTIAADLFNTQNCYRFSQQEVRPDIVTARNMVYYSKKRELLVSFQSNVGLATDRIAKISFKNAQSTPKISWVNKDQPNCLFMVRDSQKVPKPFYGSSDGNIYEMDVEDRWVGADTGNPQAGYLFDVQTPHVNFSQDNQVLGSLTKTYEFLEVEYEPTGDWNCAVDVLIDGRFQGTYQFNVSAQATKSSLNELPLNTPNSVSTSVVDGLASNYRKFEISGEGRTISLRFYNGVLGQDVRLIAARIYYRLSGQQQTVG